MANSKAKEAAKVAARTALETKMALAILGAFKAQTEAEDTFRAKGTGAFALCVKAQIAGCSWEGIETAQPALVADKVTRTVYMADLPESQRGEYEAEHAGNMSDKVKTRLRSAWDSAKSVISRSVKAGFDLTDVDGNPFTKNELSKLLAAQKEKPGAQTSDGPVVGEAETTGAAGNVRTQTPNEACGDALDYLESADGAALRTAFAERILALADVVQAEQTARLAAIAEAIRANKAEGEARTARNAAELAADQTANAVEMANAGLTKIVTPDGAVIDKAA